MRKTRHILIFFACFFGASFFSDAEAVDKAVRNATGKIGDENRQSIPEVKFREIFHEYLYSRLGKEKSDIIVSGFRIVGNKPVPGGEISFRLFQKNRGRLNGYVRLAAIVCVNGFAENEVMLTGRIDVFGSVVCVSRNLKRGEIVKEDDVYLDRKNISRLPGNVLTETRRAIGLVAKHNIKINSVLKEWMLEKAPILDRGDVVTILAVLGGIKITTPGKILQKGYPGELIRVQNSMSRKEIYARVINDSTVAVDF